jgi:hypothetical protein
MMPPPFNRCPHEDDPDTCMECAVEAWPATLMRIVIGVVIITLIGTALILKAAEAHTSAGLVALNQEAGQ